MTDEERQVAVQSAYEQALGMQSTEKPTYKGTYDQQIADTYDKIANREKFSYDLQSDPLYQQMKDRYVNQGKLAMKDTMGTAAGLTGGYGSSYSQAVGQQQYDAYLQNLTDQIPELWQNAYQVYQNEGDQLQNQYSMLRDMGDTEYSRYQNDLSNWQTEQNNNYNKWVDAYNRITEQENTDYTRQQNEESTAWSRQQALYSNLYQLIGATGYSPSDEELSSAGMSRAQAEALAAAYQTALAASQSSGSSGGSSGGSSSTEDEWTMPNESSVYAAVGQGYTATNLYNDAIKNGATQAQANQIKQWAITAQQMSKRTDI